MIYLKDIGVELGDKEFLVPYIKQALGVADDDEPMSPRAIVRIVERDENTDVAACGDLPVVTLRCPNIVATGMMGLPRRIAEGIYRGTFVHIKDNAARISTVHAIDVAKAVVMAAGNTGEYTVTDMADPTIHDLAEALAYRIDDKRIISVKPWMAKLWYGSRYYQTLTSDHTAECTIVNIIPDFKPVEVVNYLRTHNYDESSL